MVSSAELIRAMDEASIHKAVVMGVGWTSKELAEEANNYIIQATQEYPDRIIGFCSVNPNWGDSAVEEIKRCVQEGVKGIGEFHPDTQGFDITSPDTMDPIMDLALRLNLPILTHSSEPVGHSYPGKGKTTPDRLYSLVQNYPDNVIICAHWGGGLPFYSLMPEVLKTCKNIYFDTAASPLIYEPTIFKIVVELLGPEKILFGTDFPLISPKRLMSQVNQSPLTPQEKELILGGNARDLLGL